MPRNPEAIVDLRDLDPPEPMVRILDALAGDGPWRFLLSREPFPVYGILRSGGWPYSVRKGVEGVELTVERRARGE